MWKPKARVRRKLSLLFLLVSGASLAEAAIDMSELLRSFEGVAGDQFGYANVAVDGDVAVIGATEHTISGVRMGAAFIFQRVGSSWVEVEYLLPTVSIDQHRFGASVAIDGNVLAVGAPGVEGAVYVYERTGPTWSFEQRLTLPHDGFGSAVSVRTGRIAVGSPDASLGSFLSDTGHVAIYEKSTDFFDPCYQLWCVVGEVYGVSNKRLGSSMRFARDDADMLIAVMTDVARVLRRDGAGSWQVEQDVASPGIETDSVIDSNSNWLLITAPLDDSAGTDAGAVQLYQRVAGSWTSHSTLSAADASAGDWFGQSAALGDDFLAVGAPGDDDEGLDSGSIYEFRWNGLSWWEARKFVAVDGAAGDHLGWGLDASGTRIVAGAPDEDSNGVDAGSAYAIELASIGPPTADAGPDRWASLGQPIVLDGTASADPAGLWLDFEWECVDQPGVLLGTGTTLPITAPCAVGTKSYQLTICNPEGLCDVDVVVVNTVENAATSLFVSKTYGLMGNPGSPEAPLATVEEALYVASLALPFSDVYVEAAIYDTQSSLVIYNDVSVYGGYEVFATDGVNPDLWSRTATSETVLRGGSPAVRIQGIRDRTVVEELRVEADDGVDFGGPEEISSIGILVSDADGDLKIRGNEIVAGRGGHGFSAVAVGGRGGDGRIGSRGRPGVEYSWWSILERLVRDGELELWARGGSGGDGGVSSLRGGDGGRSAFIAPGTELPGLNAGEIIDYLVDSLLPRDGESGSGPSGCPSGGAGGSRGTFLTDGATGELGCTGAHGFGGAGGDLKGYWLNDLWIASSGSDGRRGGDGQGGGGGGGGGLYAGLNYWGNIVAATGGGGGGGGGGGAGGLAGDGGQGGGGSFGILLVDSTPIITDNTIRTAGGGDGGNGGMGQPGGVGNPGWFGGGGVSIVPFTVETGLGGMGGVGGTGGSGGSGGGGSGGASYCIFANGTTEFWAGIGGNVYDPGPGGAAGLGAPEPPDSPSYCAGWNGNVGLYGEVYPAPDFLARSETTLLSNGSHSFDFDLLEGYGPAQVSVAASCFGCAVGCGAANPLSLSLLTPSGADVDSLRFESEPQLVSYQFDNAEAGHWTGWVSHGAVPAQGIELEISILFFGQNLPPIADAGDDLTLECRNDLGTGIELDGSASADGDSLISILDYEWRDYAGTPGQGTLLANEARFWVSAAGVYELTVRDRFGVEDRDLVEVLVEDTTPPALLMGTRDTTVVVPTGVDLVAVDLSGVVSAVDHCDDDVTITNDAPALYPLGSTVVEFVVTDDTGNMSRDELVVQVVHEPLGELYISFDPNQRLETRNVAPGSPFEFHVLVDIDFADVGEAPRNLVDGLRAWEARLEIPESITVLDRVLAPRSLEDLTVTPDTMAYQTSPDTLDWFGEDDEWFVVMDSCVTAGSGPQLLLSYTAVIQDPGLDLELRLLPASASMFAGSTSQGPGWYDCFGDGLVPRPFANSGAAASVASIHVTAVDDPPGLPRMAALHPASPNPFNPLTTIRFDLPVHERVELSIFDLAGRKVRNLLRRELLPAGGHEVRWDGRDGRGRRVASGVYIYRLRAGEFEAAKRVTLVK